ncbi:hypothetical protein GCM10025867_46980 (plasmid) [Frondihabitans sucicola]|uniref:Uncharacterized protein n=1 Tax=Frondihabitans sucicola TaxID=1268041 RepID=A0ABN6Y8G7_9MICO|nr:hypothetical protein [Frondihabitans sucicola]BDZ52457.1 hypothetical protein GCM10025867_46980 [Frondihabitans sucicola]
MQTLVYSGTLTAMSSIAHGGKDSGTTHGFRRETIVGADGQHLAGMPIVSGSVIRGSLRRVGARLMQQALTTGLDSHRLPFSQVHALRTGGSLTETRTTGEVLNVERVATLRDHNPFLAIFGAAGGGKIMSGKVMVDKAIPIAQETAHLGDVPEGFELPSIFTLIQREPYSRVADVMNGSAAEWVAPSDERHILPQGSGQMYYAQETLVAGAHMWHSLVLEDATPVEASFFRHVVRAWSQGRGKRGPQIGGQVARGHGLVKTKYELSVLDTWGDETDLVEEDWREHIYANIEDAREVMTWL